MKKNMQGFILFGWVIVWKTEREAARKESRIYQPNQKNIYFHKASFMFIRSIDHSMRYQHLTWLVWSSSQRPQWGFQRWGLLGLWSRQLQQRVMEFLLGLPHWPWLGRCFFRVFSGFHRGYKCVTIWGYICRYKWIKVVSECCLMISFLI